MRQPGPYVRALCEAVAMLLSKNMTCARPRRNATPSEDFPHTSRCDLISALLISSHVCSHVIKVSSSQLFSSHPSTDQPFSSPRSSSQLILAVLHARNLLLSERSLLHKRTLGAESFCTHRHLRRETQMHLDRKAFPK